MCNNPKHFGIETLFNGLKDARTCLPYYKHYRQSLFHTCKEATLLPNHAWLIYEKYVWLHVLAYDAKVMINQGMLLNTKDA